MRKILFLLVSALLCGSVVGRADDVGKFDQIERALNESLQVRQKPGTEMLLRDYLGQLGIEGDTIYAVLYTPGNCPRCETFFMKDFYEEMKKRTDVPIILITACPYRDAAAYYNERNGFPADQYAYDTAYGYSKIFSFNIGTLSVPYMMKIDVARGRMIMGYSTSLLGDKFINQLIAYSNPVEMHEFVPESAEEHDDITIAEIDAMPMELSAEYRLKMLPGYVSSMAHGLPKFHGNYFFYNDRFLNGIALFETDDGNELLRQTALIEADSTEMNRFIEVSPEVFKSMGDVSYIPLEPDMISDSVICVSYSLPHIKYMGIELHGKDTVENIGYLNMPSMIFRNVKTLERLPMEWDKYDPFTSEYMYGHYTTTVFGNYKIEQCFKLTWPMEYQREDYEHDVERNPFGEGFYDTPNPILVVFDRTTGMPVKHIGKLEDCQRLSRTGYYYSNATACVHDSEIAYTNGYTGAVYVCDTAQIDVPLRRYVVFEVDTASFPPIDSTAFYTYEYARRYDKFFTRCIMQLHLTDDTVYCLVKHGVPRTVEIPRDKYEVVAIDRHTGEAVHRKFPEMQVGESLLGCGLRELPDGGIAPFMFMRKDDVPVVKVFDFK